MLVFVKYSVLFNVAHSFLQVIWGFLLKFTEERVKIDKKATIILKICKFLCAYTTLRLGIIVALSFFNIFKRL